MNKAIIIGATSGIGKELAKILEINGYELGIVGRRKNLLQDLKKELNVKTYIKEVDISETEISIKKINELISEIGSIDLFVISAGVGHINRELLWSLEKNTIEINVLGFTAMANVAIQCFYNQGYGHLVGISSIASIRGSSEAPAYNASKSFVSNYLEGIKQKVVKDKKSIRITEVQPGLVDTDMAKGEGLFWVASKEKSAKQIYKAIEKKKEHVYITKRWRVIAWLLKLIPKKVYKRL